MRVTSRKGERIFVLEKRERKILREAVGILADIGHLATDPKATEYGEGVDALLEDYPENEPAVIGEP